MIQKKYGKSLTITAAILSLLFLSHVKVQAADPPKPKPLPGIQMLLLSDNVPQPPPVPQPNIAFVTSATYVGGKFGDLDAADKECGRLAEAAHVLWAEIYGSYSAKKSNRSPSSTSIN